MKNGLNSYPLLVALKYPWLIKTVIMHALALEAKTGA
jgi:hypothetical protein